MAQNSMFSLAARNVGRNRRRSMITGVAIFFGVAMVLLLKGFVDGASVLMVSDVVDGRVGALQIHQKGYVDNIETVPTRMNLPYTPELISKIKAVPNVRAVTGRLQFNGLIGNGLTQTMFVGRAIDLEHETETCTRSDGLVKAGGVPLKVGDGALTLLGFELGESFHLKVGETVNLQSTSPAGRANSLDLKVKGFSTSTFPFENKRVLTVPLATAQDLLGMQGRVTEYAVAVNDLTKLEETRVSLRTALGDGYEVHTWQEIQAFVRDIINRQNIVMNAISAVLFIIALTVIANTMLMSVFERVREIGTLLAVGVRRRQVLQLFMLEGAILGFLGAVSGAVVGRIVLFGIAAKGIALELPGASGNSLLRPTVSATYVLTAVLIAALGSVLASAWPALKAARLNPVDALRN